jgi:hypothetical protein
MRQLSIKSRLLIMLLGVSAISIAIVATVNYFDSYSALRDRIFAQLTSLRAIKADRIESYFKDLELEAEGLARGGVYTATRESRRGFTLGGGAPAR